MGTGGDVSGPGERPRQGRPRAAGTVRLVGADLIDWPEQLRPLESEADHSPPTGLGTRAAGRSTTREIITRTFALAQTQREALRI
jgi:hypothetical protein